MSVRRVLCLSVTAVWIASVTCAASQAAPAKVDDAATPLIVSVRDAPVPFRGSDGNTHLVYELWLLNFSSSDITLRSIEVLDGSRVLQTMNAGEIGRRLQPAGMRNATDKLSQGTQGLLFVHLIVKPGEAVPQHLLHRVTSFVAAAPPAFQNMVQTGGATSPELRKLAVLQPPLAGTRFISADSCCDSTRHMRAALGVNGRVWLAQRYAIDWEELNAENRIYSGPRAERKSYTIYGKPVLAVANATVVSVTNNLPEQTPGQYPQAISLAEADGNSVILRLDQPGLEPTYAMYAHMQPNSIRVHTGEHVRPGQVIGLVGNSGNSVAPHLHFQLMAEASSLASNGLPYLLSSFQITGHIPNTAAFDDAEANGTPVVHADLPGPEAVHDAFPLDQLILSFAGGAAGTVQPR